MEYKYISPYKCNYIIGIINTPLIIILYIIISFTSLGKKNNNNDNNDNNDYYCDSIIKLFESIKEIDIMNAIILISFPFFLGIIVLFFNKIIYDFTIYHLYIPFLIENFISDIYSNDKDTIVIVFLI